MRITLLDTAACRSRLFYDRRPTTDDGFDIPLPSHVLWVSSQFVARPIEGCWFVNPYPPAVEVR